jgi:acyl-coenzyme A thioesterase PaaI-like protein
MRLYRWKLNHFPPFWLSGGRITYLAEDFREAHLELPLSWKTRNLVGTTYGGSMFSATDAVYMVMLIRLLGPDYIVWDKGGTIRFLKPGRGTLYARYVVPEQETDSIRDTLKTQRSVDRVYTIELKSADGTVNAVVERTVYMRLRRSEEPAQRTAISA